MIIGVLSRITLILTPLSLLAIGGASTMLPEIHRQFVDEYHLLDDATFVNMVAIAQTSPGPNVMIMSLIGWQIAGLVGLIVATLAMTLPSCVLAFLAGRLVLRYAASHPIIVLKAALAPIAVGLYLASGLVLARGADHDLLTLATTFAVALLVFATRANPVWGILAGAALGVLSSRLAATF